MYKTRRRTRCEAVADTLDIPRPFDLDTLCDRVAARRGRPLRLVPLEGAPDASMPCGVWVATREADLIFYEPATSALHKLHIVLHELAHLLLGHGAPDAERPAYAGRLLEGPTGGAAAYGADGLAGLAGLDGLDGLGEGDDELDLDQVLHILGRTSYSDNEEKDAELLATILSGRILAQEATSDRASGGGRAAGVLHRLNDALGHPIRHDRP
ncbi:hypothetical protein RKE29_13775 [Streptomyces sp. B1866]|uniref:hypothetical protein n=1 Tax=Streptomyces sp. B1866 TaxID=3075431 RepID=UPI00288F7509|nr:hypothetical protein [Streptomyces sp. B1866]MDT3397705.1 hypothetical protein [Streptomyces sp. B1866]